MFRHQEHLDRLRRSAELYYMELPYTLEKLREATHELIRANKLRSCYIRPVAYRGYGEMGLFPLNLPVDVVHRRLVVGRLPRRGGPAARRALQGRLPGAACRDASFIPQAKATGTYLNSILAKVEVAKAGYDEAILLNEQGNVSEGTGENVFVVRDGEHLRRRRASASILDGITARSVKQIAADLGFEVVERDIARGELYQADEVFLTGTAAEIVPVREIDDRHLGEPGELTQAIQKVFFDAIAGRRDEYLEWLDFVDMGDQAPRAADERVVS